MTMVERIASAIAASRTGTTDGWERYRGDAVKMIHAARAFPSLRVPDLGDDRDVRSPRAG